MVLNRRKLASLLLRLFYHVHLTRVGPLCIG